MSLARWPIIALAVAMHFVWGVMLLFSSAPAGSTPVHQTVVLLGEHGASIAFLIVGALALIGLRTASVIWVVPQQALLLASAAGIINAVLVGQYADGVNRPRAFIFADQLPTLLAIVIHSIVVTLMVIESEEEK